MTKRIKDDEYIRQVRMKRKKQEDQDSQAIKSSVLVLVVAMLVIVGIFGFTLFRSAGNPEAAKDPIATTESLDLAESSPMPTEKVRIPVLPDDPIEEVTPEDTIPGAPVDVSTTGPAGIPAEIPTEIPTDIPTKDSGDIPSEIPTDVPDSSFYDPLGESPDIPDLDDYLSGETPDSDAETTAKPKEKPEAESTARITISRPLIRPVIPGIVVPKIEFASAEMVGMRPPPSRSRVGRTSSSDTPGGSTARIDSGEVEDDTPPPPDAAHIIIYQSDLEGAQAFLWDNRSNRRLMIRLEKAGDNKYRATVPPGSYTMRITKTEIQSGNKIEIETPLEKAGRATLFVNSDPPGASVYLDDRLSGVTPVTITGLENRRYNIRLTRPGYRPALSTIVLDHSRNNSRDIRMVPEQTEN